MKLLTGWRPYAIAVAVIAVLLVAVAVVQKTSNDRRFGDPDVIEQIKSSTDCDELKQWADGILTADPDREASYDNAVGYSNAASDRMKEIGC